jgi:hypothetical protein
MIETLQDGALFGLPVGTMVDGANAKEEEKPKGVDKAGEAGVISGRFCDEHGASTESDKKSFLVKDASEQGFVKRFGL